MARRNGAAAASNPGTAVSDETPGCDLPGFATAKAEHIDPLILNNAAAHATHSPALRILATLFRMLYAALSYTSILPHWHLF